MSESRTNVIRVIIVTLATLVLLPAVTLAQDGAIAGVVKDTTGAVLPGVTVEAASPALIEKVRTVTTDGEGQYKIVDLRPGDYVVTFTLGGFSTVKREGIRLTTGFTAAVNVNLVVGSLEETVTVSSQSPVVDVQNVRQQRIIGAEAVELLPSGTSTGLAALVPGMQVQNGGRPYTDVGGLLTEGSRIIIHGTGSEEGMWMMNGLPFNNVQSEATSHIRPDVNTTEEMALSLGNNAPEYRLGGVIMNLVLKEGSNRYSGTFSFTAANSHFQSTNFDANLKAQGLQAPNALDHTNDTGFAIGGPIKTDKLWFFTSARYRRVDNLIAGIFHDSNLQDFLYTPDLTTQAHDSDWNFNAVIRLTWQATPRNKFGFFGMEQPRGGFSNPAAVTGSVLRTPEAGGYQHVHTNYLQGSWASPVSNRLLLDLGWSLYRNLSYTPLAPGITDNMPAITDRGTNYSYGAPTTYNKTGFGRYNLIHNAKGSMSYVTGSHAFKAGFNSAWYFMGGNTSFVTNNDIGYTFLNGVPSSITVNTTPRASVRGIYVDPMFGMFVQDQWTRKQLTVNGGLRYDHLHGKYPGLSLPARRFVGAQVLPGIDKVPVWHDLVPRLSASYDLFGTGKTAVKGAIGKYVLSEVMNISSRSAPVNSVVNSATRTWNDNSFPAGDPRNGNFVPDCDFANVNPNLECGRLSNPNFGTSIVGTQFDPALLTGWGKRGYQWGASLGFQQELRPGVALDVVYNRNWYGNFQVTDNRAVTPADYEPYCITAPVDSRLPTSGQQLCGFYDLTVAGFSRAADNLVTFASNYGKQSQVYSGVDISVNARLAHGVLLQGGTNTEHIVTNNCFVVDSPQQKRPGYCEPAAPFRTQFKMLATYSLPKGYRVSGTFQTVPGYVIAAQYTARSSEARSTLGRDFSSGANGTATVDLIAPGTDFGPRWYQVDVRGAKDIRFGGKRVAVNVDVFNITNSNTVMFSGTGYGSSWLQPLFVIPGRLLRFGAQLTF